MLYTEFDAGGKTYKLRLNTRNIIALEKRIGCHPILIFGADGETVPSITTMVTIFGIALQQYQHSITLEDAYDIFDSWVEEGHTVNDFISVIIDVYKVSGIIKDTNSGEGTEKNA